ncbi:expressed unknown protein [Seminavis robusta]|uniref:Uncharacterized protein n=1 Tax=Seminavis robusta TaxID=568900 RepID=A0A9N8HA99_9STRA|nr:expressed unknown protein [Seminavis robusta]|eukprot:Sro141_g065790.1 n/a (131) ;mRNA; f:41010-41402
MTDTVPAFIWIPTTALPRMGNGGRSTYQEEGARPVSSLSSSPSLSRRWAEGNRSCDNSIQLPAQPRRSFPEDELCDPSPPKKPQRRAKTKKTERFTTRSTRLPRFPRRSISLEKGVDPRKRVLSLSSVTV